MPFRYDPQHWQQRAEEMRRLARDTRNQSVKQKMLRVADEYDELASQSPGDGVRLTLGIADHRY
jgi:hypothetical protein